MPQRHRKNGLFRADADGPYTTARQVDATHARLPALDPQTFLSESALPISHAAIGADEQREFVDAKLAFETCVKLL
jgi:hypothetical protein